MRRSIIFLLPLLVLLAFTWMRSPRPAWGRHDLSIRMVPQAMPSKRILASYLGPFRFEGGWQLRSRNMRFYGYSSMVPQPDGRIWAFNDAGGYVRFSPPGTMPSTPQVAEITFTGSGQEKIYRDVEATVHDPATGRYWLGLEGGNQIVRLNARLAEDARVSPAAMAAWGDNTGPEAMARLPDGRFVVIRETPRSLWGDRLHEAVLFDGDPIKHRDGHKIMFDGPDNFSVVDMALLPDGRALILMRRLLWPLPMRFAGRIVIADTAQIRPGKVWHSTPLAALASVLPVDNFEAIGVVPGADGRITVWLMSDDNSMRILQRTLLWKLSVDPKRLPWPRR
ncbi:esterase-like activity of phytase family protein [Novosphingobium album (ex Hu et al. 2023)]|uniref:Esterase-like activity of phytase family protein n=1 Tax=Novosphingobium album (ex Hu et al. 2023) TaxID=2930093 RepID=A0ABT0B4H6_9SPHN|nr:esterase-like activity of phytase family protein [Novosphingobium album (ex Hu et al. 2023)]MCJ2179950.1 esterase-like activity of phytase family protein [Novosphingobium album (ex Hu et al. 2023)]